MWRRSLWFAVLGRSGLALALLNVAASGWWPLMALLPAAVLIPAPLTSVARALLPCCLARLCNVQKSKQHIVASVQYNHVSPGFRLRCAQMALKAGDLGHLAAPREVHKKWVSTLEEENFRQVGTLSVRARRVV